MNEKLESNQNNPEKQIFVSDFEKNLDQIVAFFTKKTNEMAEQLESLLFTGGKSKINWENNPFNPYYENEHKKESFSEKARKIIKIMLGEYEEEKDDNTIFVNKFNEYKEIIKDFLEKELNDPKISFEIRQNFGQIGAENTHNNYRIIFLDLPDLNDQLAKKRSEFHELFLKAKKDSVSQEKWKKLLAILDSISFHVNDYFKYDIKNNDLGNIENDFQKNFNNTMDLLAEEIKNKEVSPEKRIKLIFEENQGGVLLSEVLGFFDQSRNKKEEEGEDEGKEYKTYDGEEWRKITNALDNARKNNEATKE